MLDTTAHIKAEGKGTFVYENKWDMLDHILVSPGLVDSAGFSVKSAEANV